MSVKYLPGTWTDVCVLPDGRFAQVTTDGPTVRCFVDGVLLWQRDAPIALGQCRAAYTAQGVLSIHQGNKEGDPDDGVAFLIGEHSVTRLGKTFGAQSVAIDGLFAYIVRSTQHYERVRLSDGHVDENLPHGWPGGQGISDVVDGAIWWADLKRTLSVNGLTLTYPNAAGAVTVGQRDPAQIAGVVNGVPFTAFTGDAFEPHVKQSGDRYAIVARTPKGAAFVIVPPFPAFVSGAPAPIPVPVPQPTPEEPKPVSTAPNRIDAVRAAIAAHPEINRLTDGPFAPARGGITQAVAGALGFPWGRKSKDRSATNLSDDALCYRLQDNRFEIYDILSGSDGSATWDYKGTFADGENGFFLTVAAVPVGPDVLPPGGGPAPPAPTVPADYERRLKAVEDAVAAIEAANSAERTAVAALGEALKALNEKPDKKYRVLGSTSRDFGHSHRLNVTLEAL